MPRLTRVQEESRRRIGRLAQCPAQPAHLAGELLDALTHAVPNDGRRLFGVDPATLLINRLLAASSNDDQARMEWLREFYLVERTIPFMQFPNLMRAGLPVVGVHDSQERCWGVPPDMLYELPSRDFFRAYHEGQTPVGGAIHVSLYSEGRWIAALQMYRRDARSPFQPTEVSFVRRMAPMMGRALASAFAREHALASRVAEPDGSGVLILDTQEHIQFSSPAGETWIDLLRAADNPARDTLPSAVWAAIARLRAGLEEFSTQTLVAPTRAGPVRVEASSGGLDGSTVVVLSPERRPEPPSIPLDWALTRQERRVVELVVRGLSNSEIADRLFVSEKTVETHLGNVYEKLSVRGRNQLIARFFQTVYLPDLSAAHDFDADSAVDQPTSTIIVS